MARQREPAVAKAVTKEANAALAHRNLRRAIRSEWVPEDGIQMLSVRTTVAIPVQLPRQLPGKWSVHLSWLFQPIPPDGEFELLRSSFGLNVAGLARPATLEVRNLVRYDVDNGRPGPGDGALGRHINVWQPPPIDDHVHYPTLEYTTDPWNVDEVLSFFLSESLADDLDGRVG